MAPICLPPRRLAAGEGDVAQVEDRKWVRLRVEDPALKWHQVVAGEQQVEIPVVVGGGWGGKEAGLSRCDKERSQHLMQVPGPVPGCCRSASQRASKNTGGTREYESFVAQRRSNVRVSGGSRRVGGGE